MLLRRGLRYCTQPPLPATVCWAGWRSAGLRRRAGLTHVSQRLLGLRRGQVPAATSEAGEAGLHGVKEAVKLHELVHIEFLVALRIKRPEGVEMRRHTYRTDGGGAARESLAVSYMTHMIVSCKRLEGKYGSS